MEYFLVIGIEYKKYKQSAELSVFLDDRLVDDFTLDKDYNFKKDLPIEEKWYHELGMHNRLTSKNWKNAWDHTCQPTFYKCYKVPGNKLNDKLTIEVRNSNSNYTCNNNCSDVNFRFHIQDLPALDLCQMKIAQANQINFFCNLMIYRQCLN